MTSCAPSADTTTAPPDNPTQPPDNPTQLANLIKESNPSISGLNVTADNSDPANPKLTITGIANTFQGAPVTATINIDQDKGITTDPTSFTVTADNLISPHTVTTPLRVTFEGTTAVSYIATTQISGAAVSDWIVTEKLSDYITISFGGQTPTLSVTDTTLSITGLTNSPGEDAGMLTLGNLPAGFTVEPSTITLPNPAGTDTATSTPTPNTFTITETDNTGNSETYTIGTIDLAKLTRFTPSLHIKVAEGSTDITTSLTITEEANNMIRIVGLTNKVDQTVGMPNEYTLTTEQVPEFFTTPNGTPITRTITEPNAEFSSGPGVITGGTGSTFALTHIGESTATTYTLVVDFRATPLSITSADINGGTPTNVDLGTTIPITTAACQLLAEPMVSVVGVDRSRVASTTPFPRYYDRGRDTPVMTSGTITGYRVTRSLTLQASDGSELVTGFMITMEFPACTGFPSGQTGADAANAYQIDSAPRLELASYLVRTDNANYRDKYYKVTTDIDMGLPGFPLSEAGSGTAGNGFVPIGRELGNFAGTFDCDGNTISNLYINRPTEFNIGLVGSAVNATIRNCALTDVNITGQGVVGGLVGYVESTTITNSYTTGAVTGTGNNVGGLVGFSQTSTITDSYATGAVTGVDYVGGLVGLAQGSTTITDSYATGAVSGSSQVGGLVGLAQGSTTITDSYATGTVSGSDSRVGGLVGSTNNNPTITGSYWNTETSGQSTSAGGTGRTTAQMQVASPPQSGNDAVYVGWETSTWNFATGQYPRLINVACANRQYNQAATDCTSPLQ